ncbi:hypothetical protein ACIOHS_43555 [Streptomyces sp. NPDC088253]|uniref:hypothetical protein n=1 Tax=Streptomyces sp. NPDC088253 TaxID=3365846 RepID=UPI0038099C90
MHATHTIPSVCGLPLDPAGEGQTRRIRRWKTALNTFQVTFDGRFSAVRRRPQQPRHTGRRPRQEARA